jgi:hypothetical protein
MSLPSAIGSPLRNHACDDRGDAGRRALERSTSPGRRRDLLLVVRQIRCIATPAATAPVEDELTQDAG